MTKKNEYVCALSQHLQKTDTSETDILRDTANDLARLFNADKKGKILKLALAQEIKQQELDGFLTTLDIETLQGSDALLLAYAKLRHPENNFGENNEPRLKGLIQYYRFQNLHQAACFSEAVRALTDVENDFFASYDTAMKWYLPQYFRMNETMGIVPVMRVYERRVLRKLKSAGYTITHIYSSFSASKESAEGKKQFIVFEIPEYMELNQQMVSRLAVQEVFNNQCLIPSAEDMLCCCYGRIWQKLTSELPFQGLGMDIWDLMCLSEYCGLSRDKLGQVIAETKLAGRVFFINSFLQNYTGGLLPECLWVPQEDDEEIRDFLSRESSRIKAKYDSMGNRKQTLMTMTEDLMPGVAQKLRSARRRLQK